MYGTVGTHFFQAVAQRSYNLSSQTLSFIKDHKKKVLAAVILVGLAYLVVDYQMRGEACRQSWILFEKQQEEQRRLFANSTIGKFSKWVSECAPTSEVSEKKTYVDVLLEKSPRPALEKCAPIGFPIETSLPFSKRIQLALLGNYSLPETEQGVTKSHYLANELGQKVAVLKKEAFFEKFIRKVVGPKYQYLFPQIAPIQIKNETYTAVEFIENVKQVPVDFFGEGISSLQKAINKLYHNCPNLLKDRQIIALTDYILDNGDRHPGNILFTKHCQIVGIDHDLLFLGFMKLRFSLVNKDLTKKILNSTITPLALAFLQSLNVTQLRGNFINWLEVQKKTLFNIDLLGRLYFSRAERAKDLSEDHTTWDKSGIELLIENTIGKIQRATQLALNGTSLREIISADAGQTVS